MLDLKMTLKLCALLIYASQAAAVHTVGSVYAIDATQHTLSVQVDDGKRVVFVLTKDTLIMEVAAGATSLTDSKTISEASIEKTDRVLVVSQPSADSGPGNSVANQVIVMSHASVEEQKKQEESSWQRQGLSGIVKATYPADNSIDIDIAGKQIHGLFGADSAIYRYRDGSDEVLDDNPIPLASVHNGDVLHILGTESKSGGQITIHKAVIFRYREIICRVQDVDSGSLRLQVTEAATGVSVVLQLSEKSKLHALSESSVSLLREQIQKRKDKGNVGDPEDISRYIARLPTASLASIQANDIVLATGMASADEKMITVSTLLTGAGYVLAQNIKLSDLVGNDIPATDEVNELK